MLFYSIVEIEEHYIFSNAYCIFATDVSEKAGRSCVGGTKQKEAFKLFIRESKHLTKNDSRTMHRHKKKSGQYKRSPAIYWGETCIKDQRQD